MDIKDSYLHGTVGVVKSISVAADKLSYKLADVAGTTKTVTMPTATQSANGLLSSTDKKKLDSITGPSLSIPYIVGPDTDTTAGTWTGSYPGITTYTDGLTIIYVPKVAGASTTTLNINGLGAKTCCYTGTSKLTTHYAVGTPILFTYSGGAWRRADYYSDSNTYTSAYCATAAGTAGKMASCSNFTLKANSYLHILIRYSNTAASALTLNVNSLEDKPIYINGAASSSSNYTLPAGTYIVFYDGTNFYFRTDNILPGIIEKTLVADKSIIADTVTCTAGSSNAYRPIVVTPENNKLFYNTRITANYATGDLKATSFTGSFIGNLTGNVTGNAASTDKLKNSRKLWGLDFDGTADVSGNIISTYFELNESNYDNPYLKLSNRSRKSTYVLILANGLIAIGSSYTHLVVDINGNVGIGKVDPTQKLDVVGNVKATSFIGNLDGTYVNALTGYEKATSAVDLAATDTLNTALGKLEYKADTAYDWIISVTTEDTDKYINKWLEILDFLNNIDNTDGADLTDEFVTRKTDLVITGLKTFYTDTNNKPLVISRMGSNSAECVKIGVDDMTVQFVHTLNERDANYIFHGIWTDTEDGDSNVAGNAYVKFNLAASNKSIILNDGTNSYTVYHQGNLKNLSDLNDDVVSGKYLPLSGGRLQGSTNTPLSLRGVSTDTWISYYSDTGSFFGSIGVASDNHPYFYHTGSKQKIWHSGNDGAGSGLDADLLDGKQPSKLSVLSATKLQTPRTIWGLSFDGTANVDGTFTLLDTARDSRPFRIEWLFNNERVALNMWSYSSSHGGFGDMCLGISSDVISQGSLYFNSSTKNWGIGTNSPSAKLDVNGNVQAREKLKLLSSDGIYDGLIQLIEGNLAITSTKIGVTYTNIILARHGGNVGIATASPTEKLTVNGNILATKFVTSGGTSSQFVKGDGSLDSNTYATTTSLENYVTLNTDQTITGVKTFSSLQKFIVSEGTSPFSVTSTTKVDNLNADLLDGYHSGSYLPYTVCSYDLGCLVKTDIPTNSNTMVTFRIEGNTYNYYSVFTTGEFYNYTSGDQIMSLGALHHGHNFGKITVFCYNGYVYMWFKLSRTFLSFVVTVYGTNQNPNNTNRVTSITNATLPTTGITRKVEITPKISLTSINYNSYAPKLNGTGATGTWNISITGNAGSASTSAKLSATTIISDQELSLVNTSWTDTGYTFENLATGTYAVQVTCGNLVASGIMSVYKNIDDTALDEIPLHVYHDSTQPWRPYLRTSGKKLLISSNDATALPRSVTIKIALIL